MIGQVVLIAESDAVISLDLGEVLAQAGYRALGPVATTAEALVLLEREKPDLAIIDIALRDGTSSALVQRLHRDGVPFMIHTGCPRNAAFAAALDGVPWLDKPAVPEDVLVILAKLSQSTVGLIPDSTDARSSAQSAEQANPFVRKLGGFTALTEGDRSVLYRVSANSQVVPAQTDLAREGERPEGVFLVMSGLACRHKLRANGARQISAYLVPGDLCDLDVMLLDEMDHTITTLSPSRIVRIGPEVIDELLSEHPRIARALRKSTLVDEATLREWLVNLGRRSAIERLAHLFCEIHLRLRAVGQASEDSCELPLTQLDLADTTGLSIVHVNRSLQELRRQGLIEFKSGRLNILDPARLRALGEFRANYLHLEDRTAA